jgi:hypothetical protein
MLFLVLLFSYGASFSVYSQDKKPVEKDEVIRIDTQLVDVPVAVISPNGVPVKGLKATIL